MTSTAISPAQCSTPLSGCGAVLADPRWITLVEASLLSSSSQEQLYSVVRWRWTMCLPLLFRSSISLRRPHPRSAPRSLPPRASSVAHLGTHLSLICPLLTTCRPTTDLPGYPDPVLIDSSCWFRRNTGAMFWFVSYLPQFDVDRS